MDNASTVKRGSSSLLVLFVVFLFMLCSLFLILYGANVYHRIRDRVDADFTKRMSISYITNKLRACDVKGGVTIEDGNSSLRLCADPQDLYPIYIIIYFHDGNIMEYLTQELEAFDPNDGEVIMAADSFAAQPIPGGLLVRVGVDLREIEYTISLKCT